MKKLNKLKQSEKDILSTALWNYGQDFCNPNDFQEQEDIKEANKKQKTLLRLEKKLKEYFNYNFRFPITDK
jgi:hypothetical protein